MNDHAAMYAITLTRFSALTKRFPLYALQSTTMPCFPPQNASRVLEGLMTRMDLGLSPAGIIPLKGMHE